MPFISPAQYTIYLDESGDHSLKVIDKQYPLFGLAGVLMKSALHLQYSDDLGEWETGIFGKKVCLHMRDISRNVGPFHILKDPILRDRFVQELQQKLDNYDFMLICSVVNKDAHLKKYGEIAQNPYNLTLEFLLERFYFELGERNYAKAGFVAESRSTFLDDALQAHYQDLLLNGTRFVQGKDLRRTFPPEIIFEKKHPSAAGLQIADLAVGPICRAATGLKAQPTALRLHNKLRKDQAGNSVGYGLKVFP